MKLEIDWVMTDQLRPNPWNPNRMDEEMYQKELASIREFGFVDPITVRETQGGFEMVDGEHRWRAAKELGIAELPIVNVGPVSDAVAMKLTIVLNETRGKPQPDKLGDILKDLLRTDTKETLLATLPFSRDAFDQLIGGHTMQWDQPNPLASMQKQDSWVELLYRMPRDSAQVLDEAIARYRAIVNPDARDWQALEGICEAYTRGR